MGVTREDPMIYRGPDFLAVVWFGSTSPPPSPRKLPLFLTLPVCRRSSLLTGEGGRGWAWSWIIQYFLVVTVLCEQWIPSLWSPPFPSGRSSLTGARGRYAQRSSRLRTGSSSGWGIIQCCGKLFFTVPAPTVDSSGYRSDFWQVTIPVAVLFPVPALAPYLLLN